MKILVEFPRCPVVRICNEIPSRLTVTSQGVTLAQLHCDVYSYEVQTAC